MTTDGTESTPDPTVTDAVPPLAPSEPSAPASTSRPPAASWIWVVTLAAGLAAGFCAWLAAEPIYGRYQPAGVVRSAFDTPEESDAKDQALRKAMTLEASLTFGALGAFLGLTFGMAGGVARGSIRAGVKAASIGMMLGAAGGLAAGRLLTPMHYNLRESVADDLVVALLVQGGICAVVGAMAGAAFSLGLGDDDRFFDFRLVAGGLLGALAGLIVYQMVGGIAFPLDETTLPLSSTWRARLFARGVVTGFAAIGVMLAMSANVRAR